MAARLDIGWLERLLAEQPEGVEVDGWRAALPLLKAGRVEDLAAFAFGIDAEKGEACTRTLATRVGLAARNDALVALRERFYPDRSKYQAAMEISRDLLRYRESGWRHERARAVPPGDEKRAAMWAVLKARDHVPKERQLAEIFSTPSQ